jgi:hypothetical protein
MLILFVTGCAVAQTVDYLPRSVWADEEWRFKEDWIAGQLRAMGEPSLSSPSLPHSVTSFRLLVAPTFMPAYAIRVTERDDGTGEAIYVRLNGQGGYEPGQIQTRLVRIISRQRMAQIRDAFDTADFWSLPAEQRYPQVCLEISDILMDGTLVMYEALRGGRYHVAIPDSSSLVPKKCKQSAWRGIPLIGDLLEQAAGPKLQ